MKLRDRWLLICAVAVFGTTATHVWWIQMLWGLMFGWAILGATMHSIRARRSR